MSGAVVVVTLSDTQKGSDAYGMGLYGAGRYGVDVGGTTGITLADSLINVATLADSSAAAVTLSDSQAQ